jgi:acetyl esterase
VQNEQAYAALEWAVANAGEIGGDPTRGRAPRRQRRRQHDRRADIDAKERGGPKLAAHVLFYPVTDADLDTDSYRR